MDTEIDVAAGLSQLPLLREVTCAWDKPRKMIVLHDQNEGKFAAQSSDLDDAGPEALNGSARVGGRRRLLGQVRHGPAGFDQSHATQQRNTKNRLLSNERLVDKGYFCARGFSGGVQNVHE